MENIEVENAELELKVQELQDSIEETNHADSVTAPDVGFGATPDAMDNAAFAEPKNLEEIQAELEESQASLMLLQDHIDELEAEKEENEALVARMTLDLKDAKQAEADAQESLRALADGNKDSTADRLLELQTELNFSQEKVSAAEKAAAQQFEHAEQSADAANEERELLEGKIQQLEASLAAHIAGEEPRVLGREERSSFYFFKSERWNVGAAV